MKALFVIDKIELQYFEMNELVTSFWLIKECLSRGFDVQITTIDRLSLNGNMPEAFVFNTKIIEYNSKIEIGYEKPQFKKALTDYDFVIFRPDPPVDMDYIFATYILDYLDNTDTMVLNSPSGIRRTNEKLYINHFSEFIPKNITSSNIPQLKEFIAEYGEVVIKPLNKCFGKGVFYIKKGDKNTNSILESATEYGKTIVMAQRYIEGNSKDKRLLILGGKLLEECVYKISGDGDFKFNTHNDEHIAKGLLTDTERELGKIISSKLLNDGIYIAGLDVIEDKVIEINVTSPCFFIKEINSMFNVELEKRMVDYFENIISCKKSIYLN